MCGSEVLWSRDDKRRSKKAMMESTRRQGWWSGRNDAYEERTTTRTGSCRMTTRLFSFMAAKPPAASGKHATCFNSLRTLSVFLISDSARAKKERAHTSQSWRREGRVRGEERRGDSHQVRTKG